MDQRVTLTKSPMLMINADNSVTTSYVCIASTFYNGQIVTATGIQHPNQEAVLLSIKTTPTSVSTSGIRLPRM